MTDRDWRPRMMTIAEAAQMMKERKASGETEAENDPEEIVFITDDTFLKDGRLDETDLLVFEQMRTGKTILLFDKNDKTIQPEGPERMEEKEAESALGSPEEAQEFLETFAEAVKRRTAAYRDEMTDDQAEMIRMWRVVERGSWRYVARHASEEWGGEWGSNQIFGLELCEAAAAVFGESYLEPPWN